MFQRLLQTIWPRSQPLDGTKESLWAAAAKGVPFRFRWFNQSLSIESLNVELANCSDWIDLRRRLRSGDRICPFTINKNTLSMRQGYVVLRKGKPVDGIITLMS